MTKKDYELLSEALKSVKAPSDAWQHSVCAVADALKKDNYRFDSNRFFQACGTVDYRKSQAEIDAIIASVHEGRKTA